MNNKLFSALGTILVIVVGFFLLSSYVDNQKEPEGEVSAQAEYFADRMVTLGIEDIGHPIEGFDNNLLIMAFPGLVPNDFSEVETFEGYYEVEGEDMIFVREQAQPVTSAERTISKQGYATLLENVSRRLNIPVTSEAEVDQLIEMIDTGERIETKINQGASALGVRVTPYQVLEDSRCPPNANCVQAGTLRLRATLESGLGTADQVFELNQTITTEAEEVTLLDASPVPQSGVEIEEGDYTFTFEVKKR